MACKYVFFFFQAEDGIRDSSVTGVQTCALPIFTWTCGAACAGRAHPAAEPHVHVTPIPERSPASRLRGFPSGAAAWLPSTLLLPPPVCLASLLPPILTLGSPNRPPPACPISPCDALGRPCV